MEIDKQLQQVMLTNNEARSKLVADVINSMYCGLSNRDVIIYLVNYLDALLVGASCDDSWSERHATTQWKQECKKRLRCESKLGYEQFWLG